jgi:cytochrome P450
VIRRRRISRSFQRRGDPGEHAPAFAGRVICFWPDPHRFDPGRFTAGERPVSYTRFPFGGGPRTCLGNHFGRVSSRPNVVEPHRSQDQFLFIISRLGTPPIRREKMRLDGLQRRPLQLLQYVRAHTCDVSGHRYAGGSGSALMAAASSGDAFTTSSTTSIRTAALR